ncbi:MAG: hypothetical protein V5789_08345 [Colwellia sp.]
MSMFIRSKNPELNVTQQYFLVVDNSPQVPTLTAKVKSNEALTVLTLSPEDAIRMQSLQKTMKNHLRNGGKSDDFGFSIVVLNGCKNTRNIPKNVFVSLFIKLVVR